MVLAGVISTVPDGETNPILLLMEILRDPETLHMSADVCPLFIVSGEAVNNITMGSADDGFTVTVAEEVTVPIALVADKT